MDRTTPARRRLGVQARREAILAAAAQAFAAAPYADVAVREVASAAGASEALVHKYFDGKSGLYTAVVAEELEKFAHRRRQADASLPPNTSARDRLRVFVEAFLDHAEQAAPLSGAALFVAVSDPEPVRAVRLDHQSRIVDELTALLRGGGTPRQRYAVLGFVGFLGAACQAWVEDGRPPDDRGDLVTATLGAFQGALGDWGALTPLRANS